MEQTQPKPAKEKKTIYDVGFGTIFIRNFMAGFAKGLGAITVYIFLGGIIYYLAVTQIIPKVNKLIPNISPLLGPINTQPQNEANTQPDQPFTPEQLEEQLKLLQQKKDQQPPEPSDVTPGS